jgi:hypothetical protein
MKTIILRAKTALGLGKEPIYEKSYFISENTDVMQLKREFAMEYGVDLDKIEVVSK